MKYKLLLFVSLTMFLAGNNISAMAADDLNTDPTLIPAPYTGPKANSPSWESTVDNLDGTYTFIQGISAASTAPHYTTPSSGGFSIYSWYDEDYSWQHSFPYAAGMNILSSSLTIRAWDVDSEVSWGTQGEFDGIFGDGSYLNPQYLQGRNGQWSVTNFDVNPSTLTDGILDVHMDIDMTHTYDNWATTLDYSELEVIYSVGGTNNPPAKPTLSISPACPTDNDNLLVAATSIDPDGDPVIFEYRWLVDTGTGFYVDDEFASRGNHLGNTVPAADTQIGDKWKVQVIAVDSHGAKSDAETVDFAEIGSGQCSNIPEFPSLALPVISVIGIMLMFARRNGRKL